MTSTTTTAAGYSPAEVIERARQARQTEHRAAADQLAMALVWARLHPCPVDEVPAHWGEVDLHGESVCPLAGVGAPWVAEFAPADLGAALGITVEAAKQLLGDALELAHRLPRLWALVQDLTVPAWRARLIARETRDLGPGGRPVRRPVDRRHPGEDRIRARRAPGPGSPAVLRPRPGCGR